MKRVATFFAAAVFVICLCGTVFAGSVKGNIQCTSGAPSEGMVVYLPGDSFSSITNETGGFLLRSMPAGTYSLKVRSGDQILATIGDVKVGLYRTNLGTVMVNCEGTEGTCSSNSECSPMEFCAKPAGDCGGMGVCQTRPEVCSMIYAPVCGCDGRNYSSSCDAAGQGVNVAYTGLCK